MEDGYYNDSYDKVERGLSFPGGFHSHGILDQLKAIVHAHFFILFPIVIKHIKFAIITIYKRTVQWD